MSNLDTLTAQAESARKAAADAEAAVKAAADDLEQREQAARAEVATWRYETRTKELAKARDEADAAWSKALGNPGATLEQLWSAWLAMRVAARVHFDGASLNASNADNVLGMHKFGPTEYMHGQDRPRPRPHQDYSKDTTWEWAVEKHLELIAGAAVRDEAAAMLAREEAAITEATKG